MHFSISVKNINAQAAAGLTSASSAAAASAVALAELVSAYGRWLDRHVLWQGEPPEGYNNRESGLLFELAHTHLTTEHLPMPHIRVSHLRRQADLRPKGQGLLLYAAAHPDWWVPRQNWVCRAQLERQRLWS